MKINKKLLPLKAHFFLCSAGIAPIAPFIPIIAKQQLGFTSISVGWILTACPIVMMLFKPFVGAIADKYKCRKFIFLALLLLSSLSTFCIKWIKPLPSNNTVQLFCNGCLKAEVCSESLKDQKYIKNLFNALNVPVQCKIILDTSKLQNTSSSIFSVNENSMDTNSEIEVSSYSVQIFDVEEKRGNEDSCVLFHIKTSDISSAIKMPSNCSGALYGTAEMFCNNEVIQHIVKKPIIGNHDILSTNQFWFLFILVVGSLMCYSIYNSIVDAITFVLLGDKPKNYGFQRVWGSLGWGLSSMVCGVLVDKYSEGQIDKNFTPSYYIAITAAILDVLVSSKLEVKIEKKSKSIQKDVQMILKDPKVIVFAVWCFLGGAFYSFIWNFLFWFIEDLSLETGNENKNWLKTLEGLVAIIQCYVGEIPFLFFSGKILEYMGVIHCMSLVLFGFALRFLLYTIISNPWWILPIEPLNGITYSLFYATMTSYASKISPPGTEATVQNIFSCLYEGAGTAFGGLLGGYLIEIVGSSKTFLILGISALVIGILHVIIQRNLAKREVLRTDTKEVVDEKEEIL